MSRLQQILLIVFLILISSECVCAFKILVSVPKFGFSHLQTMGKLADVLVELGHDVTMLCPVAIELPSNGTKLAKVVLVPPSKEILELTEQSMDSGAVANLWKHSANSKMGIMWSVGLLGRISYLNAKTMLTDHKLVEQMRNEKFDIGITELFDFSGLAFFDAIGLENVIGAHTTSVFEGTLLATGSPILPSFIPGSQTFTDDSGSLLSRINNIYMTYYSYKFQATILGDTQKALDEIHGKAASPKLWSIMSRITWFFVNSDPLFDFPKPIPHNVVEISGISVAKSSPLEKKWDEILSKRKKNVLVSFGSIATPTTLPENVKKSIIDTFAAFPDVTFIWKYDDSKSKLAHNLDNVFTSDWIPQNDLLADDRVSLFWTHGGMASLLESAEKAVPLIVVPIFGDQMRNAQIAKRHGMAEIFDKMELGNTQKLIATLRNVLNDPKYKESAKLLSQILATERISPRQKIKDTIEFAGKFGPMPRWTCSSKEFSFLKYYNIDIALIVLGLICSLVALGLFLLKMLLSQFGIIGLKPKSD